MIKRVSLLAILLALLSHSTTLADSQGKDTCKVGIYILSLYDIDFPQNAYSTAFWMWFLYKNDSLHPLKTAELSNAKSYAYQLDDVEKKEGVNWATQKCIATIKQSWNVEDFPFDEQRLKIVIEDANTDTSGLVYTVDSAHSRIDPSVQFNNWQITSFRLAPQMMTYRTNYGDPSLAGSSTYPAVVASITLKRDGLGLFFKLFTGVYVAFAIAIVVFFIDPIEVDPRFGLSVGAIFATVGNKYIVDSALPDTATFTLVDKIHVITFIYILLSVILSVISLRYYKDDKIPLSKKIDAYSFWFLTITFILFNLYYIIVAVFINT